MNSGVPAISDSRGSAAPRRRPRHAWLYALRDGVLPEAVWCNGRRYERVETFKHDFFAATGLYRGPDGLAVLKVGRTSPVLTLPFEWLGRRLMLREVLHYSLLQDLPGVPRLIGTVGRTGFLHDFVPGHPLGRDERVSDAFFDQLLTLLSQVHERGMAYVDLNKRQNILVGDDGRPHLIDFQISLYLPRSGWRGWRPLQWLLSRFQHGDWYHALKHKRRLRPDLLTDEERGRVERVGTWIRLHRAISRPITNLRRRTLKRLGKSETTGVAGSAAK